jgi:hypothetical protein
MFIVVYAFDYVDLPQLQDEVKEGMSEPGKSWLTFGHAPFPSVQNAGHTPRGWER